MNRSYFQLLHPREPVAVHASKPEEEPLGGWQTTDDVIRRTERKVSVGRIARASQKVLGVALRLANEVKALQLALLDQAGEVGLHASGEGEGDQGFRVLRV